MSCEGRNYFSWLREQLSALADVVLIDSRTGVTEMGGVCTRHLPDAVVSFCAPNFQNVDGVLQVMSGVNGPKVKQERGERHVDVLVIPTRIDLTESDRLEAFRGGSRTKSKAPNGSPTNWLICRARSGICKSRISLGTTIRKSACSVLMFCLPTRSAKS